MPIPGVPSEAEWYRVVTNGREFKVQERNYVGWFRPHWEWEDIVSPFDYDTPLFFATKQAAETKARSLDRLRARYAEEWRAV